MQENEALRSTILQQSEPIGRKQRFGLFSQPLSTAVGDNGAYITKTHALGQNGKPITQPRNFYTNPTKQGQLQYFQPLKSLASSERKDLFIQQGKRLLKQEGQKYKVNRKQTSFFPSSTYKTITNAAYQYLEQNNPELDPKRFRAEDGRVRSQPKNLYTNSTSKKAQMEVQSMRKSKALSGQSPFRPNNLQPKPFNSDKKVYALDVEIDKKPISQPQFNLFAHETPFRRSSPMKSGHDGFISPFPKYIENLPKLTNNKQPVRRDKQSFRSMSSSFSKPSPSITQMSVKRSFHQSHRK